MPSPGFQIYIRPHVTLTSDLLTPKLIVWTTCANSHQNRFIPFQNIAFASLVATNGRTDERTARADNASGGKLACQRRTCKHVITPAARCKVHTSAGVTVRRNEAIISLVVQSHDKPFTTQHASTLHR